MSQFELVNSNPTKGIQIFPIVCLLYYRHINDNQCNDIQTNSCLICVKFMSWIHWSILHWIVELSGQKIQPLSLCNPATENNTSRWGSTKLPTILDHARMLSWYRILFSNWFHSGLKIHGSRNLTWYQIHCSSQQQTSQTSILAV